jgi:pyruvate-formate lyase-activating enzyme
MIECKYCSTIVFYKFSKVCRADIVKNKSTSARFNILSFLFLVVSIGEAYPYLKSLLNKHTLNPIYPLHKIIMYIRNICLSLSSSLSVKVTFQISRFHFSKKKKTETQPETRGWKRVLKLMCKILRLVSWD